MGRKILHLIISSAGFNRVLILMFLFFLTSFTVKAEDPKFMESVKILYRGDEVSSLALMEKARDEITEGIKENPSSDNLWLMLHYAGLAEYRIASYYQYDKKDESNAYKHLKSSIDFLQKSKELKTDFPENYALISSCYGSMLSINSWKGFYLGPMAGKEMNAGVTLGRKNPRVWLLKGIGTFYTPETFGGGKDKAIRELKIAERLFLENAAVQSPLLPSWGNEEVYIWLGNFYKEKGELNTALIYYEKGLKLKPDHVWIKNHLLPDLLQEMKGQKK